MFKTPKSNVCKYTLQVLSFALIYSSALADLDTDFTSYKQGTKLPATPWAEGLVDRKHYADPSLLTGHPKDGGKGTVAVYNQNYPPLPIIHNYNPIGVETPFTAQLSPETLRNFPGEVQALVKRNNFINPKINIVFQSRVDAITTPDNPLSIRPQYFYIPDAPSVQDTKYAQGFGFQWNTLGGSIGKDFVSPLHPPKDQKVERKVQTPQGLYIEHGMSFHNNVKKTTPNNEEKKVVASWKGGNLKAENIKANVEDFYSVMMKPGDVNSGAVTYHWLLSPDANDRLKDIVTRTTNLRELLKKLSGATYLEFFGADRITRFKELFSEEELTIQDLPQFWNLNGPLMEWGLNPKGSSNPKPRFVKGDKESELAYAKTLLKYNKAATWNPPITTSSNPHQPQRDGLSQNLTIENLPQFWNLNGPLMEWGLNPKGSSDPKPRFVRGDKESELAYAKTLLKYNKAATWNPPIATSSLTQPQRDGLSQNLTIENLPQFWELNGPLMEWGLNPKGSSDPKPRFVKGNKESELAYAKNLLRYNKNSKWYE